ncbi:putative methyltransferase PMT26 [Tasmannia lanceolata]|uniref:putative methyltransferase PMT26 n=1 Tax=Tasmannia lanceolata TaxID=3420 RepID=UPI00406361CD
MAFGKNQRMDIRRSSPSYCSTIIIAVFVALCLVGVWMISSSTMVPVLNLDMPPQETKSNTKEQVTENDAQQFKDSPGDLPEVSMRGHTNTSVAPNVSNFEVNQNHNPPEKTTENPVEDTREENSKEIQDTKNESDDLSKTQTEIDRDQETDGEEKNMGGGEVNSDGGETNTDGGDQLKDQTTNEVFPDGAQSEILNETNTQNGAFSTQAKESKNEKEAQESSSKGQSENEQSVAKDDGNATGYSWKFCNVTAGPDYIPCLDNEEAIRKLRSTKHYEHRERHCPEEGPTCLVPLPDGYKQPIKWPHSRDRVWYANVPHTKLAALKGHQNWVKVSGEYLIFPGGGTQFKNGALHYIDFIQKALPGIAWGKTSRVVLDVGCGVASFGGYLFDRDVLTMSLAPKDEHEAQVQFALERGIPAISAVMGTKRLPFPSKVFDVVHCARCRVPWHIEGGMLLLELNRVLRPGGYFVWSATPVYRKSDEDVGIWNAMSQLTKSMCWEMVKVTKDRVNEVGVAIFKKPSSNICYKKRLENKPPLCPETDDPNAAWNIPLQACIHRVPEGVGERGSHWPEKWPLRMDKAPYWLNDSQVGVYGKPALEDFRSDYEHWKNVVRSSYLKGLGISWSKVRNVMDMRSVYGGFAAALRDLSVWVMNVVSIDAPDTLPIIYERGLFGMYHDWCESFSSYPRTYDLLHADHLFSNLKKRCKLVSVIAEVDRLLRPEGKLIVRDNVETIKEIEDMVKSLQWEIHLTYSENQEGLLCVQKSIWRPKATVALR